MFDQGAQQYKYLTDSFWQSKFDNGIQSVVVVMRHINDLANQSTYGQRFIWDKDGNVKEIVHTQPNKNGSIGEDQSIAIAKNLPTYINNRNNTNVNKWAPIGIIHTHHPTIGFNGLLGSTPNPFESCYAMIRGLTTRQLYDDSKELEPNPFPATLSNGITNVNLYNISNNIVVNSSGTLTDAMNEKYISAVKSNKPRVHSELFIGTRDTLFSINDELRPEKDRGRLMKGTLLDTLNGLYDINENTEPLFDVYFNNGPPEKGKTMFIYYYNSDGKGKVKRDDL